MYTTGTTAVGDPEPKLRRLTFSLCNLARCLVSRTKFTLLSFCFIHNIVVAKFTGADNVKLFFDTKHYKLLPYANGIRTQIGTLGALFTAFVRCISLLSLCVQYLSIILSIGTLPLLLWCIVDDVGLFTDMLLCTTVWQPLTCALCISPGRSARN